MNVLALDLSLNATGVAYCDGSTDTWTVKATGAQRLLLLEERLVSLLDAHIDLVVIEGYAFGRPNSMAEIGEWGGVCRLTLHRAGQAWLAIPPANLKKYATGKGNAAKAEVLTSAVRRLGYEGSDDNQADALWLRAMTLDHYGHAVVDVPAVHRDALAKLTWPDVPVAA